MIQRQRSAPTASASSPRPTTRRRGSGTPHRQADRRAAQGPRRSGVSSAAFSPDGKRIVTASEDKTARLWDAATGKPIGEPLKGHEKAVSSAAFSPDGKRIVTASMDKTARVWDVETGKPIGEPLRGHADALVSAAFSPGGKRVLTTSSDGMVRLWEVFADTQALVSHTKTNIPRCLSAAQRNAFFPAFRAAAVVHRIEEMALPRRI